MRGRMANRVIHSLMPKGVEHNLLFLLSMKQNQVIHSLMPKGVEHLCKEMKKPALVCDSFVDAERR